MELTIRIYPAYHFIPLRSKYCPSTLFPNNLNLCYLNVRDYVSHPYKITGKIIVLHILSCTLAQSVQSLTTDWTAGVQSLTEAEDFSSNLCIETNSGAHPASYKIGTGGSFPRGKGGWGVMSTTHPLPVPRLRKSRSYTSSHPKVPLCSIMGLYLFYLTHLESR
jgi:hypothetical protein